MNLTQLDAQFEEFMKQSAADGRNFPLKAEGNNILTDDSPDVHQPHNGFGYLMHCGWAARKLVDSFEAGEAFHHDDFGSYLYFAAIASAIVGTFKYHDIRPYEMPLSNLFSVKTDITKIPHKDGGIESASCLHVLEHIGLGRYGDKIDSLGDVKAARELTRILDSYGHLIFAVPVNKIPGVVFNAHRQYTFDQVTKELFPTLELLEFTLITQKDVIVNADPNQIIEHPGNVEDTGCFYFRKP